MNFGFSEAAEEASNKGIGGTPSPGTEEITPPDSADKRLSLTPSTPRGVGVDLSGEGVYNQRGRTKRGDAGSSDNLERDSGRKRNRTVDAIDIASFSVGSRMDSARYVCVPSVVGACVLARFMK